MSKTLKQTAIKQVSKTCRGFIVENVFSNHYVVLIGTSPLMFDVKQVVDTLTKKGYFCYGLCLHENNIAVEFRVD